MIHSTSSRGTAGDTATVPGTCPTRSLWLVRHGESTWNTLGLAQGHCDDAELTRRGADQAQAVAAQFRGRPVRALYASDLRRAMQTAAPLAAALGLAVITDTRLRERSLGILEGGPSAAILPAVSGLRAGRVADPDTRPAGGESVRDLYQRAAAFADDVAGQRIPGDTVVVAHGGTLRVLAAYLRHVPVERMSWDPLANGCVLRIAGWPDQLRHE
jgi:2,3-bisphosphoglycerate-dependent phosphoglycerate mutase